MVRGGRFFRLGLALPRGCGVFRAWRSGLMNWLLALHGLSVNAAIWTRYVVLSSSMLGTCGVVRMCGARPVRRIGWTRHIIVGRALLVEPGCSPFCCRDAEHCWPAAKPPKAYTVRPPVWLQLPHAR